MIEEKDFSKEFGDAMKAAVAMNKLIGAMLNFPNEVRKCKKCLRLLTSPEGQLAVKLKVDFLDLPFCDKHMKLARELKRDLVSGV